MKQMIRYISVFVLLVCSTVAFAETKVEIAEVTGGTITSSMNGQTCTLTVTPDPGYCISKRNIKVQRTVAFGSRTRGDIPMAGMLTLSGDDPDALSAERTYTFEIPEGYSAYVKAKFFPCAVWTLSVEMKGWTYGDFSNPDLTNDDYMQSRALFTINDGNDVYKTDISYIVFELNGIVSISKKGSTDFIIIIAKQYFWAAEGNDMVKELDAGDYTLKAVIPARREFAAFEGSVDFTVAPKAVTVTAEDKTKIYGETDPELSAKVEGLIGEDKIAYTLSRAKGEAVGEYAITASGNAAQGNYSVTFVGAKLTITAKTVSAPTITLSETSYVYDGQEKKPTVTVKDGDAVIPATEYSVSYTNNVNVGTATVTITDVAGGNYTVSGSATFAISSADGSLTPPAGISGLVYSGKAQALISAGSSTTGTIQYSLDGTTYGTDLPTGTDAKEYTVYYKSVGDKNHNDVAAASLKVTIAPKSVTVTAEDKTKVEGEADPELTAKVEGLIGTDKVAYTLSRDKGEDVGEYAITVTGEARQGNYAVTFVGAKLTITAKPKPSGDVNGDGVVNIVDVVALSKAIIAGSTDQKYDINGDGSINAKDITALVALIANL